ncbi:hypothetical protein PGT21_011599 [Puccinia graminis f. sp. tritici]|uniref:Uncharacterized protein n=1 Tax=Puccinia graminis f. sp. tritici TaxID=56615 RepID=A0A5B0QNA1_PUCGR|nr:hypothetical protein PGT21_011599 [Puccinia graminis f. sp. tritici]KAA1124212.1 hypothetical protein PGTUg99_010382 [Puccinia graminis f. sp. tritici]
MRSSQSGPTDEDARPPAWGKAYTFRRRWLLGKCFTTTNRAPLRDRQRASPKSESEHQPLARVELLARDIRGSTHPATR